MVIRKTPFFLLLFGLIVVPIIVPRLIWLARSRKTVGVMGFEGRGTAGDQIALTYWHVYYRPEEMGGGGGEMEGGDYGEGRIWFTAPSGLSYVVPGGSKVRLSRKRPYISLWSTHRN